MLENKKFRSYPSTNQFRQIVKDIRSNAQFSGLDEDGNAIFDKDKKAPIITFKGTVKLHGTNAGFTYDNVNGEVFQSRKNIITVEKDNAACAFMMNSRKELFIELIKEIAERNSIDLNEYGITLFMELCGGNIQKGVAISGLPKMFVIFPHCKVFKINNDEENVSYWLEVDE